MWQHSKEINLGTFITYTKNIHFQNILHLILDFTFDV
jgi:hypothetical protein